ncbi:hypothetical protein BKA61DRAFT_661853 [Leptodontidium sp. MPI-SDFR-AT-0119]|nr:hypothetical protein BKA61DRAFT_661853 [Leptodontidium sp. MPI-SDFR-AT-0119]
MSASVWKNVSGRNQPNITFHMSILLTDGSVMVQNANATDWWRLTPDLQGQYESGSWTGPFNMTTARKYYSSGVLSDGRVFVIGGEYAGGNNPAKLTTGEIFDPDTEKWSPMNKPTGPLGTGFDYISTDAAGCILADGRVILGSPNGAATAIWDPVTDNWSRSGLAFGTTTLDSKQGNTNEETWTLLQDGTVLAVNIFSTTNTAEKYIPALDIWMSAGTTNTPLPLHSIPNPTKGGNSNSQEIGPMLVLPNGKAFAVGGTGNTGVYDVPVAPTLPGSWETGPTLPSDPAGSNSFNWNGTSSLQTAIDAPGCLLPCGKVLFAAGNTTFLPGSPGSYWSQTNWYIYDSSKTLANQIAFLDTKTGSSSGKVTYQDILLLLPTGQVLHTSESKSLELLTPGTVYGSPDNSWRPNLVDYPQDLVLGKTYNISGNRLNGLSQANSYGDDVQNATNYPILQLTSTSSPTIVKYLKTFNFSYMGISAIGDTTPQTAAFNVPTDIPVGQYDMRVIANGIASGSKSVSVLPSGMEIILNVNSFSQSAVHGLIDNQNGTITPMLYVAVDGLKPSELGIFNPGDLSNPGKQPKFQSPGSGITVTFAGPAVSNIPSLPDIPQRFTFPYSITFADESSFNWTGTDDTHLLAIVATLILGSGNLVAASVITLTKNPNPFILHGADINIPSAPSFPFYLSVDIRVFTVLAGQTKFGLKLDTAVAEDSDNATSWIQSMIKSLNQHSGQAQTFFNGLPQTEETSALNLAPTVTPGGPPVYNFALARVRYRDTVPTPDGKNVRVLFRMWPGAQLNATFNTNTLNRFGINADGEKIAKLGVVGDEIITIPFFAQKRIDTSTLKMDTQTDPANVQKIDAAISGGEVDAYFGAWIDINTPSHKYFPDRILDNSKIDGPFVGVGNLLAVQDMVRSQHQCILAEISFDPDPITATNADPSNNDKLAQRNLSFIPVPNPGLVESRRAPQVFEIRPTPAPLAKNLQHDELLIEWGHLPTGTTAQIYAPAVAAKQIISLADSIYGHHLLSLADESTIETPAEGNTFIPVPPGVDAKQFAALITLEFPLGIKRGQSFTVIVKQLTTDSYTIRRDAEEESTRLQSVTRFADSKTVVATDSESSVARQSSSSIIVREGSISFTWRRVLGTFAITVPVHTKTTLLAPETQLLSILRSIQLSIARTSRWYPVFNRYVEQIAGRVSDMGGDPGTVFPDPYGGGKKNGGEEVEFCGKVVELCYDCKGCFDGFGIEVECEGEDRRSRRRKRFECFEGLEGSVKCWWERGDKVKVVVGRKRGDIKGLCVVRREEVRKVRQSRATGDETCADCRKRMDDVCEHDECQRKRRPECEHCKSHDKSEADEE